MRCAALRLESQARNVDMFWSGKKNAEHFLRVKITTIYPSSSTSMNTSTDPSRA